MLTRTIRGSVPAHLSHWHHRFGGASSSGGGSGGAEGRAAGGLVTADRAVRLTIKPGCLPCPDHEYVVKAAAVSHYSVGLFEALNSLAVGSTATGGLVGGSRVAVAASNRVQIRRSTC